MTELSFTTDKRLVIRSCSDGLVQLTGMVRADIIGKKYHQVFPRIIVRDRCALTDVLQKGRTLSLKGYRFQCLQSASTADVRIAPDRDSSGGVRGSTVTIRPVTACHVASKLTESQRLIETGKIAAMFAHGVRNPLNAIKGAVVYLRDAYAAEQPIQEFTQIMEDEIYRLEHYVSQFLSSTANPARETLIDINSLISRITTPLQSRKFTRQTRFIFEPGTVPLLRVNAFQLEQAVLNVVNNAVEAMDQGGTLSIKTGTERYNGALCIVVQIADTGPGMPSARAADLAARQRKGKGFGLQIAYEAVKRLNGHLEITSKKDKGTTVRFFIPVSRTA